MAIDVAFCLYCYIFKCDFDKSRNVGSLVVMFSLRKGFQI